MKILFALIFSLTVYSFSIDEIIHAVSFHFPDNIWNKELQTEATDLCKTYLRLSAKNEFFECSKKTCPSILDSNIFIGSVKGFSQK